MHFQLVLCRSFSLFLLFFLMIPLPPRSTLFPYTTLFRSMQFVTLGPQLQHRAHDHGERPAPPPGEPVGELHRPARSEEHTSELQSHSDLVCRLLLEKKKKIKTDTTHQHMRENRSTHTVTT